MRIGLFLVALLSLYLTTGCVTPEKPDYSALMTANPKSILVLMPKSLATDVDAGPAVLAAVTVPLSERGYYVFPVAMVNDTFRYNGITEAEEMRSVSYKKLHDIYGADAVLDLTIEDYASHYELVDSVFQVTVQASLSDLRTGRLLWQAKNTADNASSSSATTKKDFVGALFAGLVKHALNNITNEGYTLAKDCMESQYSDHVDVPLLRGPYSPRYRQDPILTDPDD